MAVTTTKLPNTAIGITYSVITDSSSDWPSVSNDVYFFDKATDLPYYKNSSGTVVKVFEEGGGADTFVTGGTYSGSTIILNRNDGNAVNITGITSSSIYTANGTLTGNRIVDLGNTNNLTIQTSGASSNLYINAGEGGYSLFNRSGGLKVVPSTGGNDSIVCRNNADTIDVFNVEKIGGGYWNANGGVNIGRDDGITDFANFGMDSLKFYANGSLKHKIGFNDPNDDVFFQINGALEGRYFIVGSDTPVANEAIGLHGATLIKGIGTAGSSALSIYDNASTPSKVFEVLDNGKLELSSTNAGFLMPRLTTAQKNAISSPDTNLMVFDTDLNSLQRYNGTAWVALADGYGILGIASTGGNYTYYSTYTLAMTAAVAGETVEQFGNITETSNVTITIKDGVSINMNGYTYTTDGSTVGAFYHDDNGYEQTRFQNGTVKHINTGGVSNALSIGGESHMDCTGLIVISDGAYCLNFNTDGVQKGRLIGGSYIHTGGSGWNHIIEGNVYGAYFNTGDGAVRLVGGSLDNCRIDGSVFIAAGIISNSRVIGGSYSHAISNEGTVFNTYASSALFRGINNNTNGTVENSTGISNASDGIYSVAGTVNNSRGKSTASYGIYMNNANAYANGCIAESSAAAAIRLGLGKLYNCKAICTFDDPSGDGILITGNNGFEIIDCYATVVNSSAFAVDGTQSGVISGLKGRGMTALIGSTTNTLTNTTDAFNNGLIG